MGKKFKRSYFSEGFWIPVGYPADAAKPVDAAEAAKNKTEYREFHCYFKLFPDKNWHLLDNKTNKEINLRCQPQQFERYFKFLGAFCEWPEYHRPDEKEYILVAGNVIEETDDHILIYYDDDLTYLAI